jgi:hypothetical protein
LCTPRLGDHDDVASTGASEESSPFLEVDLGRVRVELTAEVEVREISAIRCWGDVGRIYYWIREQDLRSRAFDAAWLILQCT